MKTKSSIFLLAVTISVLFRCANPGQDSGPEGSASQDITGTTSSALVAGATRGAIVSQSGFQGDLKGWWLVLTAVGTSASYMAVIDENGLVSWPTLPSDGVYTLALLTPNFLLSAVLAQPVDDKANVQQYFKFKPGISLPRLVQKGAVMMFQTKDGIEMDPTLTKADNQDGIPNGVRITAGDSLGLTAPTVLINKAYTQNRDALRLAGAAGGSAIDDDGDGIIDIFDSDDDGDGITDAFDSDANGDGIEDIAQTKGDLYFGSGVKWVGARYSVEETTDGSISDIMLTLAVQVDDPKRIVKVTVDSTPGFLNQAQAMKANTRIGVWDQTLVDDGQSDDGAAADGLFAKRVSLGKIGQMPNNRVVVFRVSIGEGGSPEVKDYIYRFPNIKPKPITTMFEPKNRTVTLNGEPFGVGDNFVWEVAIVKGQGEEMIQTYSSPPIKGSQKSFAIPHAADGAQESLHYQVIVHAPERIAGYPAYSIKTPQTALQLVP